MKFVPPVLFLLFGFALAGLWALERKLRFALTLAAGFGTLSLAMFSQFGGWPPDIGRNAVISGTLYVLGALLVGEGILQRSGRRFPSVVAVAYIVAVAGGLWYFFYVDRSLIARIYILNFGMALVLLHACWLARHLTAGTRTDKALFYLLLICGLHFLPRTLISIRSAVGVTTPEQFGQTEFWQSLMLTTTLLGAAAGLCLLGILVVDVVSKLRQERDLDPLTGVLNRRGLDRYTKRGEEPSPGLIRVAAICDLDKFKAINDSFGHDIGDAVLTQFAEIIRQNMRSGDVLARTGGEEFALVLEDITEEQALALAERVRSAVEAANFPGLGRGRVTCSFGLARILPGEAFWASLKRADKALYEAKGAGRNRIRAEWQRGAVGAQASAHRP
ncbi:GGDEF domain-containing protein [Chelativorans sp.]|uniref:GGDEF domain-containing protein n=1 Tax=Chelativorans sp. TaxID=2203393 RepID=UPI0028124058|nr:GGDEF domain-containing protein [Chelativorans sp.]